MSHNSIYEENAQKHSPVDADCQDDFPSQILQNSVSAIDDAEELKCQEEVKQEGDEYPGVQLDTHEEQEEEPLEHSFNGNNGILSLLDDQIQDEEAFEHPSFGYPVNIGNNGMLHLWDNQIQDEQVLEPPSFEFTINGGNGSLSWCDDGSTQPSSQIQFDEISQNDHSLWSNEILSASSIEACSDCFDEEEPLDNSKELLSVSSIEACSGCLDEEESLDIKEMILNLENVLEQNPQDNEELDSASGNLSFNTD